MPRKSYNWQLPPEIESRLGNDSYGPQRAIFEADHLLLILHRPPSDNNLKRESILFLLTPDGQLHCNGKPDGEARLTRLINDYRSQWEELENKYNSNFDSTQLFKLIETATPLKHSATNLANAIQAARSAAKQCRFFIEARDASADVARAFEIMLTDLKGALDFRIAKKTEEQIAKTDEMATAQHKLNLLAAFTFPLMAVATLLGMNLPNGLAKNGPSTFWTVLALGIGIGFFVKNWILKKKPNTKSTSRIKD